MFETQGGGVRAFLTRFKWFAHHIFNVFLEKLKSNFELVDRISLLGVLLLFKVSRTWREFKPFKTSCELIFF